MKQAINPVVGGIIVLIIAAGAIFWLVKGTNRGPSVAPMSQGNKSPFSPGGAAVSGGGANPDQQKRGGGMTGNPGMPGGGPPR